MRTKKILFVIAFFVAMVLTNIATIGYQEHIEEQKIDIHIKYKADQSTIVQGFFAQKGQNSGEVFPSQKIDIPYNDVGNWVDMTFSVPAGTVFFRLDPASNQGVKVLVKDLRGQYGKADVYTDELQWNSAFEVNMVNNWDSIKEEVSDELFLVTDEDSYFVWEVDADQAIRIIKEQRFSKVLAQKIIICVIIDALFFLVWIKRRFLLAIPREIWENRKLMWNLSLNDFKQKFAGSYLGIIWAFVNPIVTVLLYWFVFSKALNAGATSTKAGITVPYVLWLVAGLVPWFYFAEVLNTGTNTLIEYNYLVKKVVFKISTLPMVKAISSLFVHLFFIAFMLILYCCHGMFPTIYTLQIVYYSFAMFMLALGFIYATSAIMVFFRDLGQIIGVILQVGMWMTPIMWNVDAMAERIPGVLLTLLKMNPMFYIVNGYRDSLISGVGFWEHPLMTAYFWIITIICLIGGTSIFRKLQHHFADVL